MSMVNDHATCIVHAINLKVQHGCNSSSFETNQTEMNYEWMIGEYVPINPCCCSVRNW